jgi:hypothetical protein
MTRFGVAKLAEESYVPLFFSVINNHDTLGIDKLRKTDNLAVGVAISIRLNLEDVLWS